MLTFPRMTGLLSLGCLIVAGILYLSVRPAGPQPPFEVMPSEITLTEIEPGLHDVIIRIKNPGEIARRIIGLEES